MMPMVALCVFFGGTTARLCAQEQPSAQGERAQQESPRTVVPEFSGPYSPNSIINPTRRAWGFGLVGAGAITGGLGLYWLETSSVDGCVGNNDALCEARNTDRIQLGAGLLIGGVFLSGVGRYLLVSDSLSNRTLITTPIRAPRQSGPSWHLDIGPTPGGAMLRSGVEF